MTTYRGVSCLGGVKMSGETIAPRHRDLLVATIGLLEAALRQADEISLPDVALKICHALDLAREALESVQNGRS